MFSIKGLTEEQVLESRKKHGSNSLTEHKVSTFWSKLMDNAFDPMIIVLLAALVIVIVLWLFGYTEWYEGVGIAVAVALATLVSTWSEFKNEETFQKLQQEASKIFLNVFRGSSVQRVNIDDIVVGDKILLEPGDKIPADGIIVMGQIKVNQAMLNGEPEAVPKTPGEAKGAMDLEDSFAVFRGSIVEDGEAVLEVTTVGDHMMFGKLASDLKKEDRPGPLRAKLSKLANQIARFAYIGAPLIALAFMFKVLYLDNHGDFATYFSEWQLVFKDLVIALILAVIIIVVVVPEGLPMMIAIVLAQNMQKLLKSKVLVRQLLGIETAGSLNILYTDKTGTITLGKLDAVGFLAVDESSHKLLINFKSPDDMPYELRQLLDISVRENSASIVNPEARSEEELILGGNSTERALLKFVHQTETSIEHGKVSLLSQVHFNSDRKYSAARILFEQKTEMSLVKGAAEIILEKCNKYHDKNGNEAELTNKLKEHLTNQLVEKADAGFRIIGLATSSVEVGENGLPDGLCLVGFSLIRDELKSDARPTIESLQKAGIQVVMITGDRHGTAIAIAKEAGIMTRHDDIAIGSKEMASFTDSELKEILPRLRVVSRCLPSDKSRLVKISQELGLVVGMTGDGVNDSPALSKADVGFALGSGTEVAKEASDIVLLDDNIHSVTSAVHYGRTIYRSVQKFITFQLTVNVSAILLAFIGPFLGFELPLTMIQLLWVNLIMDTLAALAFSGEPPLPAHMEEAPKSRDEHLIVPSMWSSIFANGIFITILCIVYLKLSFFTDFFAREDGLQGDIPFLTAFFTLFVFLNNFNKFNVRVSDTNLFHHLNENKGFMRVVLAIFIIQTVIVFVGGKMFRTTPLLWEEWAMVIGLSFLIIPFDIIRKRIIGKSAA